MINRLSYQNWFKFLFLYVLFTGNVFYPKANAASLQHRVLYTIDVQRSELKAVTFTKDQKYIILVTREIGEEKVEKLTGGGTFRSRGNYDFIQIIETETGIVAHSQKIENGFVEGLSPDGSKMLLHTKDGKNNKYISILDPLAKKGSGPFLKLPHDGVQVFSRDSTKLLTVGYDADCCGEQVTYHQVAMIWDLESDKKLFTLNHGEEISDWEFLKQGKQILLKGNNQVTLWDMTQGKRLTMSSLHQGGTKFVSCGEWLLTEVFYKKTFLDKIQIKNLEEVSNSRMTSIPHNEYVDECFWLSNSQQLLISFRNEFNDVKRLEQWELLSSKIKRTAFHLKNTYHDSPHIKISPHSKWLIVTQSTDAMNEAKSTPAELWNLETAKFQAQLRPVQSHAIEDMWFSSQGNYLLISEYSKKKEKYTLHLWGLPSN